MDEQKTQTSAQPEHIPLLLIARELWRKLGLILMFAATVAACGYIAATLLYRPVYQTQTTFCGLRAQRQHGLRKPQHRLVNGGDALDIL